MGTFKSLGVILASIATMMINPLGNEKNIKAARRSYHFATGGGSGEYHSRRRKFKGWMRENRRSTFNKNK